MGDPKQPTAEFFVLAQALQVADRVDERFLDDIQAGLLVVNQLKYKDIQRQLVAAEERVPGLRVSLPGLRHEQLFAFSHYQHLPPVECR